MTAVLSPPVRSQQQRLTALREANRIRLYRAGLKAALAAGHRDVIDVLEEEDPLLETMKVADLLLACRSIGTVKRDGILRECAISHSKTLGGMTPRQIRALLSVLLAKR